MIESCTEIKPVACNESATKIQFSNDYGMFHFLRGNRDLNETKIKKIIKSVESGLDFFKYCPIMVNEDYFIIDGQHRFYVCKKLKRPVYFVVVPNFSLRQVAEINNNQTRWKATDYMNCYIDANVNREDYQYLANFIKLHKLNISIAVNMLMYGRVGGGGNTDAFKDGNFTVKFADFASNIISKAKDYEPFGADFRGRQFLQAIEKLLLSEKYDHNAVIEKLKKHNLQVEKQSSYKEYLKHLEELYNYRNAKRQIIY